MFSAHRLSAKCVFPPKNGPVPSPLQIALTRLPELPYAAAECKPWPEPSARYCEMCIIDRYLLRQFVQTFAICFVSLFGLYVVIEVFANLDGFISSGQKAGGLLRFIARYYSHRWSWSSTTPAAYWPWFRPCSRSPGFNGTMR